VHEVLLFSGQFPTPFPTDALEEFVDDRVLCDLLDRSDPRSTPQEMAARSENGALVIESIGLGVHIDGRPKGVVTKLSTKTVGIEGSFAFANPVTDHFHNLGLALNKDFRKNILHVLLELFADKKRLKGRDLNGNLVL
jgi:hypothetical protein